MVVSRPSVDDLLVLLEVARTGQFVRAAETLKLNHVTVSRRISALERALGGKVLSRTSTGWALTPTGERALAAADKVDGILRNLMTEPHAALAIEDVVRLSAPSALASLVAAPAAARVHRRHPGVSVEIVVAIREATLYKSGLDIEIVVGQPRNFRAESFRLTEYALGLYATQDYLGVHGTPSTYDDLRGHRLVYYVPSMLSVDELDVSHRCLPPMSHSVTSTNVAAQVQATRAGGGLGLLPSFLAERHDDLIRQLADVINVRMEIWLVARLDALRRPAVSAVIEEIRATAGAVMPQVRGVSKP